MSNFYKKSEIVLVQYPYTNMSQLKVRPALVIRDQDDDDVLLLPISTTLNLKKADIHIKKHHYKSDPLPVDSVIRMGKLMTLQSNLILKKVGQLEQEFFNEVHKKLIRYLS